MCYTALLRIEVVTDKTVVSRYLTFCEIGYATEVELFIENQIEYCLR